MPKQLNVSLTNELHAALKEFHLAVTAEDLKGDAPSLKEFMAAILESQLIKSSLACTAARDAVVRRFPEINNQMQKPCYGWCCGTCAHWYLCHQLLYEGEWEIKDSVGNKSRIFPRGTIAELTQAVNENSTA
jgi:hypothetical protein